MTEAVKEAPAKRPVGRPRKPEGTTIDSLTIYMQQDEIRRLDEITRQRGTNTNEFIRTLVRSVMGVMGEEVKTP